MNERCNMGSSVTILTLIAMGATSASAFWGLLREDIGFNAILPVLCGLIAMVSGSAALWLYLSPLMAILAMVGLTAVQLVLGLALIVASGPMPFAENAN